MTNEDESQRDVFQQLQEVAMFAVTRVSKQLFIKLANVAYTIEDNRKTKDVVANISLSPTKKNKS